MPDKVNPIIYALAGNVGSGKTTLGKALSKHFGGIPHLSSDGIREELTGGPNGQSKNVFKVMRDRLMGHIAGGSSVVLDSTGMSPKYKSILDEMQQRKVPMHKIQLNCDRGAWKQREGMRTDRWDIDSSGNKTPFVMEDRAFNDSSKVDMQPHLKIDTTNLKPEEVFNKTIEHITKNSPQ